jgi:uncharacterized protein
LALIFGILIISLMTNKFLTLLIASIMVLASAQGNQCTANTFQVTGNGAISVSPDIVYLTISAVGNGSTAASALSKLNTQVNTILSAFKTLNIPAANYSTSSISIKQLYNYSNTPVTLEGSQARQSLKLTLGGPALLQTLTQTLSAINVSVRTMVFDVADRTTVLKKARAAAFLDAKNKFSDYLSLTSLSNDGLKKISDLNS